jgi:dihydroneopterin aldolase
MTASSSDANRVAITLAGMRFHVRVGILPHERELAQPLEIDLTVQRAQGIAAVLDYRELYAIVRDVVGAEPLDFLETIGANIATSVLALPGTSSVRVAVRKPHVALGGPLAFAEIVVERGR